MANKEKFKFSGTLNKGNLQIPYYINTDERKIMFVRPTMVIGIVDWEKFQPWIDQLHRKYDNLKEWQTPNFLEQIARYIKTMNNYVDVNNQLSFMLWDLQRNEGFDMSSQISNYYGVERDISAWYNQLPENAQAEIRRHYLKYITKYIE